MARATRKQPCMQAGEVYGRAEMSLSGANASPELPAKHLAVSERPWVAVSDSTHWGR
jgi:hypothetical protein